MDDMSVYDADLKEILKNPKSIFSVLSLDEKKDLLPHLAITNLKSNELVYKEGDRPTAFIILMEGKIKIFKEGFGGRELIIRMTKPLGYIGYRALISGELHIASAVTLENSTICSVSSEYFFNKLLKNPEFSIRILRKMAAELGFSNSRTVNLTQKHIRGRLAESLVLLKEKYGYENDGVSLKAYLSREDIAKLSNMTTSNAIRTLANLADEKVIAIDGRIIKILDFEKLDRISKLG